MTGPAHVPLASLAGELRRAGGEVVIESGAQGRVARMFAAVGYRFGVQAVDDHHTASSGLVPRWEIDFIIRGKGEGYVIANAYTSRKGVIHLIASGPTYTAGTGGPLGLVPRNGANAVTFSNEIANRGDGKQRYPAAQVEAVDIWNAVVPAFMADLYDWPDDPWSPDRLWAHHEWTSRKIDPFGPADGRPRWGTAKWAMNAVRGDGRSLHDQLTTPSPPSEEDDMSKYAMRWRHPSYADQWLIGIGNIERITPAMATELDKRGLTSVIVEADHNKLIECVRETGIEFSDLTPAR